MLWLAGTSSLLVLLLLWFFHASGALIPIAIVTGVFLVIALAIYEALVSLQKLNQARARMAEAAQRLQMSNGEPRYKAEFLEAARDFYGRQRKDGIPTLYDEQRITNDLAAHSPSPGVRVAGNYISNTHIDYHAEPDRLLVSQEAIQSAILRAVRSSTQLLGDGATLAFIHERVKARRDLIAQALHSLQLEGVLEIGNRDDGAIVYRINELGGHT